MPVRAMMRTFASVMVVLARGPGFGLPLVPFTHRGLPLPFGLCPGGLALGTRPRGGR